MAPKKVLIVDDHLDTRVICRELFTHFGYVVFEAADGTEALDVAKSRVPDLILLDFLMPRGDGLEVLRTLRAHAPLSKTAIVLYTAAATEAEKLLSTEGVQRVVFKPSQASDLLRVVSELIGEAGS